MSDGEDVLETFVRRLLADPWAAHVYFFEHRHPEPSGECHWNIVQDIHSPYARRLIEGFRGMAKSTLLEESAILRAALRRFHNMVIVGASYTRACDRLAAIKRECEINQKLADCFGSLRGNIWQEGKIVLANGVCIHAVGRDQSITGMKYLDWRPDAALVDDLEDPDEVRADPEREATWKWFLQAFLPSLSDPVATWVRVLGTRRGVGSLPERLENAGWMTSKYPIEHKGENGERKPTWPSKFPLAKIDMMIGDYVGDMHTFNQEFMCQASSSTDRVFTRDMFRYENRERTWEPVYCMIDPARTSHGKAASTGWAAWSWVRNRLIVWGCGAHFIAPDEIVALAFDLAERFDPVWIGVEKDGLEQFLMQPLRHEQIRRGVTLPIRPMAARDATRGRGQTSFVAGLQPYFANREVVFAQPFTALEAQLLSFPHGIRDTANALAYAPTMRPAAPIYDGFTEQHIVEDVSPVQGQPLHLAANATGAMTAALLVQAHGGVLRIFADWVMEGPPADRVSDIAMAAILAADTARWRPVGAEKRAWDDQLNAVAPDRLRLRRETPGWVVPPHHSDRYGNTGLMQAIRHLPAEVRVGGENSQGSLYLRDMLNKQQQGMPAVEVGTSAHWTLRAFAGGYTRRMINGRLQDAPEEGPYRLLMEALEAFCGLVSTRRPEAEDDDNGQYYRYDERTGARYASAMPNARAR